MVMVLITSQNGRSVLNKPGSKKAEIVQMPKVPMTTPIMDPIIPSNPASRVQVIRICLFVNPIHLRRPISRCLSERLKPMVFIIPKTPIKRATLAKPSKI